MRNILFILTILAANCSYSQNKSLPILHDTTDGPVRYIDFSNIDTVSLWNYDVNYDSLNELKDSLKIIGRITFFRSAAMKSIYDISRKPYIQYNIYSSIDSLYAYAFSRNIKQISSCFMLQGGEKLHIGKYILVNSNVCSGFLDQKGNEICLPLVDHILSILEIKPQESILEIFSKLPIKASRFTYL